jgi:hypothetical protein
MLPGHLSVLGLEQFISACFQSPKLRCLPPSVLMGQSCENIKDAAKRDVVHQRDTRLGISAFTLITSRSLPSEYFSSSKRNTRHAFFGGEWEDDQVVLQSGSHNEDIVPQLNSAILPASRKASR